MAHSNRALRKAQRKAKKVSRKAAWVALIGTSRNRKQSKQTGTKKMPLSAKIRQKVLVTVNGKVTTALRAVHAGAKCGNIGCKRCSLILTVLGDNFAGRTGTVKPTERISHYGPSSG